MILCKNEKRMKEGMREDTNDEINRKRYGFLVTDCLTE